MVVEGRLTRWASATKKPSIGLSSRAQLLRFCVVRVLSDSDLELLQPFGLVLSMNNAAEEPERFGNVVVVEADVLPGRLGILPHPLLDIVRLCET